MIFTGESEGDQDCSEIRRYMFTRDAELMKKVTIDLKIVDDVIKLMH